MQTNILLKTDYILHIFNKKICVYLKRWDLLYCSTTNSSEILRKCLRVRNHISDKPALLGDCCCSSKGEYILFL